MDLIIPADEFVVAHGASRFAKADRVADLKRKGKTGRDVELGQTSCGEPTFHARGSCSLIICLNQPKRHQLAKIDLHECHDWKRMAQKFHVSLVIVSFSLGTSCSNSP